LGGLAGLFVSERLIGYTGSESAMYMVGAVALFVSMLVQLLVASRRPTTARVSDGQPVARADTL
jgi:hypothetical protein